MKIDKSYRLVAKLIDFLLLALLSRFISPIGVFLAVGYILVSDGLFEGQSIGKRIMGLHVEYLTRAGESMPCDYKHSLIRNLPFAVFVFFSAIPLLNILILFLALVYCLLEAYFILQDKGGIRIGDIYAETRVKRLGTSA